MRKDDAKSEEGMPRSGHRLVVACVIGCLTMAAACAVSSQPKKMVPYLDYSAFRPSGKTIRVDPVRTGQAESPSESLVIGGEAYGEVLRETLARARIFRLARPGESPDYVCRAEIVSQKVIPGLTANAVLFVSYRIVDARTQAVIWKESILSQVDTYGGDLTNAVESATRDNLSQFILKVSGAF